MKRIMKKLKSLYDKMIEILDDLGITSYGG